MKFLCYSNRVPWATAIWVNADSKEQGEAIVRDYDENPGGYYVTSTKFGWSINKPAPVLIKWDD